MTIKEFDNKLDGGYYYVTSYDAGTLTKFAKKRGFDIVDFGISMKFVVDPSKKNVFIREVVKPMLKNNNNLVNNYSEYLRKLQEQKNSLQAYLDKK